MTKYPNSALYFDLNQVDSYETIYTEVDDMNPVATFDIWFRVDGKPFKQALLNIIKKWSFIFKQYLIDHVTDRYAKCGSYAIYLQKTELIIHPFIKFGVSLSIAVAILVILRIRNL